MLRTLWLGYAALAIGQASIGVNVVTSKYLLSEVSAPFLLLCRFFISSACFLVIISTPKMTLKHPDHPERKLTRKDWSLAILQGLLVGALFNVLFLAGLSYTSAASAGIISSSLPAIITLFAVLFLKERLTQKKLIALGLAMAGIALMSLTAPESAKLERHILGDFLIFLAMFPEASYSIINKLLFKRMTALGAVAVANTVSFISVIPLWVFSTQPVVISTLSANTWGLLLLTGVSSLLFFWLWAWAVTLVPASTAALFGGVMPISTLLLAVIFLNELIFWPDLLGMGLIFISIGLGTHKHRATVLRPAYDPKEPLQKRPRTNPCKESDIPTADNPASR